MPFFVVLQRYHPAHRHDHRHDHLLDHNDPSHLVHGLLKSFLERASVLGLDWGKSH